jgi:quinol monooxygenase YgiN
MVIFRVRIHLDPRHRTRVLQSLVRILGPTRVLPGCVSCQLCSDVEEENALVFFEEWQTQEELEARLREDSLRVVLAALDYAIDPPEIRFVTTSETKGIEFIAACRLGPNGASG